MKCPVCSKGEIEIFSFEQPFYNDDSPVQLLDEWSKPSGHKTIYDPVCNECGLTILDKNFPTPELALEAMKPVVSEELIREVFKIGQRYTYKMFYENGIGLIEFIKQELEKDRNKE
jgi:hypothetical protein